MTPPSAHGAIHSIPAIVGPPIMHEGWVLKKRRKKMQGAEVLSTCSAAAWLSQPTLPLQIH